jgi:hypothetical protein
MRSRSCLALLGLAACASTDPGAPPDARFGGSSPDAAVQPCEQELECPAPDTDKLTVCGRLYDVESGSPISGFLHADFFDTPTFAADPETATDLAREMYQYDACGRYRITNLEVPASHVVTIVVDDSPQGFPEDHTATLVTLPVEPGQAYAAIPAHSITTWSEQAWVDAIGSDYRDLGSELIIHQMDGVPVAGVAIDIGTGSPQDAYAFSDGNVSSRTQIAPGVTTTGINGAELRIGTEYPRMLVVTIDEL